MAHSFQFRPLRALSRLAGWCTRREPVHDERTHELQLQAGSSQQGFLSATLWGSVDAEDQVSDLDNLLRDFQQRYSQSPEGHREQALHTELARYNHDMFRARVLQIGFRHLPEERKTYDVITTITQSISDVDYRFATTQYLLSFQLAEYAKHYAHGTLGRDEFRQLACDRMPADFLTHDVFEPLFQARGGAGMGSVILREAKQFALETLFPLLPEAERSSAMLRGLVCRTEGLWPMFPDPVKAILYRELFPHLSPAERGVAALSSLVYDLDADEHRATLIQESVKHLDPSEKRAIALDPLLSHLQSGEHEAVSADALQGVVDDAKPKSFAQRFTPGSWSTTASVSR